MRLLTARPLVVGPPSVRRPLAVVVALLVLGLVLVAALRLEAANRTAAERAHSDAFYGRLYGFAASGPVLDSLAELGRYSQAVVLGRFDGRVEPGRVVSDPTSTLGHKYDVYFANIGFSIEAILAGNLPAADAADLLLENLVGGPNEIATLAGTLPTERTILFVARTDLTRRQGGTVAGARLLYYIVGLANGAFRELDGRTAPVGLMTDPQFGRLEGLPFADFLDLVRQVPTLDEPLEPFPAEPGQPG